MKKWLLLLVAALMLCGCAAPDYPEDTFFEAELLESYCLSDLPQPKLENSRLKGDSLYLNLTEEEYEAYVAELVAYLRGREDVYHLSYYVSRYLLAEIAPVDVCAPLPENYDCSSKQHKFLFTYTPELTENGRMTAPIRITVLRDTQTLFRTDFTYNTEIIVQPDSTVGAEVDPCAGAHSYDAGTVYPVPGLERSITVYRCIHCGAEEQDWYLSSTKQYAVTVAEGLEYIWGNNWNYLPWGISSMYAGLEIEIITLIPEEGELQVFVNGEAIPVLRGEDGKRTFGFIMPESDVRIEVFPAETE